MRPPRGCCGVGSAAAAARTMTARALWMCAVMTARAHVASPARRAATISTWWARLRRSDAVVVGVEVAQHDRRVDRAGEGGGQGRVVGERDQPVVEGPVERDQRVEVLRRAGAADVDHRAGRGRRARRRRPGRRGRRRSAVSSRLEGRRAGRRRPRVRRRSTWRRGHRGWRWISTSPSAASRHSASRTGVRLTPSRSASSTSPSRAPGGQISAQDQLSQGVRAPARRTSATVSPVTLPGRLCANLGADPVPCPPFRA